MRMLYVIVFISLSAFGFSQESDINQIKTVESLLTQLVEKYEADKELLQYDSLSNIMKYLKYSFIENTELINIENNGYDFIKINISETINLDIRPSFADLHLTGGFTYCIGNINIDGLKYIFYLMNNGYREDRDTIYFCFVDANDENFIYRVYYLMNDYEILEITKYINTEGYLESGQFRISNTTYYDYRYYD